MGGKKNLKMVISISYILKSWENTPGNGSGWLRWLLKQEGVILAHPSHRDNTYALELPFDYYPSIQGPLQLPNIPKWKTKAGSSSLSSYFCLCLPVSLT
jgi:hypothetical protein